MKTLTTILLILCGLISIAQNNDERFVLSVNVEPNALTKDGFNIGMDINYQMTYTYFSAGFYTFPNLNNVGYTQIHGTPLGFNLHSKLRDFRGFTGLLLGVNIRQGQPNPVAGIEGGLEWYFKGIGIGIQSNYLKRGDSDFYGSDK